ncbi:MAG: EAL domain-containing protein [Pseudomonas sp.]|nr:EAL domain-containing protein [Pseudomonas sp.]RCL62732.1 MAG: EAL domain-containing protein [Pseudomonas sp.]TFZ22833.1 EAL domain-containing protein [Stutzerimonas stutzeri]
MEFEVTEGALIDDAKASRPVMEAQAQGVRLAGDDFGIGYAAPVLSRRSPIDVVKLDRSFVTGIAGDVDRYLFTCTIVDMARSLKLHVVGCRGCRDNGAVASSGTRLGAKLSVRPYRSIRQAAVGRETAERPKSVLKSC